MGADGGTKMYCSKCRVVQVCSAVPLSQMLKKAGQRWYKKDHPDIQWFRRGRRCHTCDHHFITAEVDEKFIDELVELRDALSEIKKHSEQYIKESKQTASTLEKLSSALSTLQALKLYQESP